MIVFTVLSFFLTKKQKTEVIYIYSSRGHDEVLLDQKERFMEEGYSFEKGGKVSGELDKIILEMTYHKENGKIGGEPDIFAMDFDEDLYVLCEVKTYDAASFVKKAYSQLVRAKKHYEKIFPGGDIRTCMRLGDQFQEILAESDSDLKEEVIREFEKEGIYETISKDKKFYRKNSRPHTDQILEQDGIVSVFAESKEEKEIAICNTVMPVKENLCISTIERLKNRKRKLMAEHEDYEVKTYIKAKDVGLKSVDSEYDPRDVDYSIKDEILDEAPHYAMWAKDKNT